MQICFCFFRVIGLLFALLSGSSQGKLRRRVFFPGAAGPQVGGVPGEPSECAEAPRSYRRCLGAGGVWAALSGFCLDPQEHMEGAHGSIASRCLVSPQLFSWFGKMKVNHRDSRKARQGFPAAGPASQAALAAWKP